MGFAKTSAIFALACAAGLGPVSSPAADAETRTIRLRQDDAQVRFESKIYELEHASAEDILPFVNSAILRYNRNSSIRRVTASSPSAKSALLVSTGRDFIPYVDAIVKALDRPGRTDAAGSVIESTGMARIAYTPKYRAAQEFSSIIDSTLGSSVGAAYVNA
ncbi:MAG: hypothetical protein PHI35_09640, partial [Victivallaceae bacterium]|nr:hypothetical protein [Victivallaceae bacterium]